MWNPSTQNTQFWMREERNLLSFCYLKSNCFCFCFSHSNFWYSFLFLIKWMKPSFGTAILSMILGNLIAITQINMKRMLAYSSIGQISYVISGIVVRDPNGWYVSTITHMFSWACTFCSFQTFLSTPMALPCRLSLLSLHAEKHSWHLVSAMTNQD